MSEKKYDVKGSFENPTKEEIKSYIDYLKNWNWKIEKKINYYF